MPRIVGVDIPKEKRIEISLTYIKGIGRVLSKNILDEADVDTNIRAKELNEDQISRIASVIQNGYKVEGELRRMVSQDIRRLIENGSYRGMRHKRSLPVHGQRTHTNARTRKGPKKSGQVGRKK
ncbi:30S ribosomal protein S13 [PVC group bacterium (ex Bugula neritina AB1)]|nr:30S ribosomal protein S13 [PVC group bacterium (ex Bugula neritina AB1)]